MENTFHNRISFRVPFNAPRNGVRPAVYSLRLPAAPAVGRIHREVEMCKAEIIVPPDDVDTKKERKIRRALRGVLPEYSKHKEDIKILSHSIFYAYRCGAEVMCLITKDSYLPNHRDSVVKSTSNVLRSFGTDMKTEIIHVCSARPEANI